MDLTCVTIEGGLLAPDFLEVITDAEGQKPSDFGITGRRTLVDEVSSVWSDVRSYWDAFNRRLARAGDESRTTITREQWVIPLLETLSYDLEFQQAAADIDGRRYRLSHRAGSDGQGPPVHIEPYDQDLGTRPPSGRGNMSPHAMVQDYLNRSEDLWAVVTNGSTLRLLRDSSYFTRPSYVEFDLRQMLEGERLDEFFLFYRLVHRSRLPETSEDGPECLLEQYHQQGIEQGGRIRDGLRDAVEQAIILLGNGFLKHPKNEGLLEAVRSGELTSESFYQQLLYLIYRLLFLMAAEERNLLTVAADGSSGPAAQAYFSIRRLRDLSEQPLSSPERFTDLYMNLRALFFALCRKDYAASLSLPPLDGELFENRCTRHLGVAYLDNGSLLRAIGTLSHFTPKDEKVRRRVNYGALDVEELGSVYESLLDFQPIIRTEPTLSFELGVGTERKTTGSYYTRPELVQELVKSALVPVIEDRLQGDGDPEQALLSLNVCDPACGSGHFLLAAARRIGNELAKVRTGEEAPAPEIVRAAVRDVITHCIYGVDKNPLAVDLCKVALWIEGHSGGKPLTFLDHRIRCGDSLVGVFDLSVLEEGIPDKALDAVSGDDKAVAKAVKARNKQERKQRGLAFDVSEEVEGLLEARRELGSLSDDTPEDVRRKREAFEKLQQEGGELWHDRMACNIWAAAFFWPLTAPHPRPSDSPSPLVERGLGGEVPTTDTLRRFMENPNSVSGKLIGHIWALAERNRFFHWPLEFPEVFDEGGFDCVLSNPPWERIKLQEKEFFATRDPEIANAPSKSARDRLITSLADLNPHLLRELAGALHAADSTSKLLRYSGRFPLTAKGDINTYAVFAELNRLLLCPTGRTGIVVPTGIATDDSTKAFFGDLVATQSLTQLCGFENEEFIFAGVANVVRFCTLILLGSSLQEPTPLYCWYIRTFRQLGDRSRFCRITPDEIALLNPNTRTCPIFRTSADAELTKHVYRRIPVLVDETSEEDVWGVRFLRMIDMANDSDLFETCPRPAMLPLYEAKLFWHFDHRFSSYEFEARSSGRGLAEMPIACYEDPTYQVEPRYWVPGEAVARRVPAGYSRKWLLAFRDVSSAKLTRTAIFSILPLVGVGHKAPIIFTDAAPGVSGVAAFLANANSLPFDYTARQKVGGTSVSYFILKQLPVLPPRAYTVTDLFFIVPRVVELVYTAWDIKAFADDVWREGDDTLRQAIEQQWEASRSETGGHEWAPPEWAEIADDGCPLPPFKWSEERRAVLRAELDAYYARLYGLNRKQLRYILDPHGLSERELEDILDPWEDPTCSGPHLLPSEPALDFPGETFRVLKNKEEKAFGEYRTRRLVLEAWERLADGNP